MTSEYLTAVTAAGTTIGVGLTIMARSWTANPARHRNPGHLPSLDVLIGPPAAYTAVDPDAETQSFGVVQPGFGWCDVCWETKAGVITRNGFRCDDFTSHPAGGAM